MLTEIGSFVDGLGYIDGITIIDTSGTILFSVKFNPRLNPCVDNMDEVIGRKLFEVFTNVDKSNSTLIKAMELGMPVYRNKQSIMDVWGNKIDTMNLSLPIKANGRIIGAVELSKDITKYKDSSDICIELNSEMLGNKKVLKEHIVPDRARFTVEDIITDNPRMKELKYLVEKIADSTAPVFIYGETGTGKEIFAHAIHNASSRSDGPFIAQNCAAIPENLLESILFGTTKGSFTGAGDNPGLFELAEGGSLFLDEINCMPVYLQSKLLRVLQDGFVRRLGDTKERRVNVRIISAANRHPEECVREGQLRADIYYRLCVLILNIPPLRERKEDIGLLLGYFISKYNKMLNKNVKVVSKKVYEFLSEYSWPGNVRELEHIAEYAMNIIDRNEAMITLKHIEGRIGEIKEIKEANQGGKIQPLKDVVSEVEKEMIGKALRATNGNVSRAAKLLEIPRQTLQRKRLNYNL